jgi:hypothetical protein
MFSRFRPVPTPGSDSNVDSYVKDARERIAAAQWAPANARRLAEDASGDSDSPSEDSGTEDEGAVVTDRSCFKYPDPPSELLALRPGLNGVVDAAVAKVQAARLEAPKPTPPPLTAPSSTNPLSSAVRKPVLSQVVPTSCDWDRDHPAVVSSVAKVQEARQGDAAVAFVGSISTDPPNPAIDVLSRVLSLIGDYKSFGEQSVAAHAVFLSAKEEAEKLADTATNISSVAPVVSPPASDSEEVGNDGDIDGDGGPSTSVPQPSAQSGGRTRASDEKYDTEEARARRAAVLFAQHVLACQETQAGVETATRAILDKASVSIGPLRIANPYFAGGKGVVDRRAYVESVWCHVTLW